MLDEIANLVMSVVANNLLSDDTMHTKYQGHKIIHIRNIRNYRLIAGTRPAPDLGLESGRRLRASVVTVLVERAAG